MSKHRNCLANQWDRSPHLRSVLSILSVDRAEAQLILNDQFAQIQKMHAKMTAQKEVLAVAKATCRNKGRCFVVPKEPKPQRSLKERVAREFARIPRNLRRIFFTPAPPPKKITFKPVEKDYAEWVAEHEPTADDLENQRRESSSMGSPPKNFFTDSVVRSACGISQPTLRFSRRSNLRELGSVCGGRRIQGPRDARVAAALDENGCAYSRAAA